MDSEVVKFAKNVNNYMIEVNVDNFRDTVSILSLAVIVLDKELSSKKFKNETYAHSLEDQLRWRNSDDEYPENLKCLYEVLFPSENLNLVSLDVFYYQLFASRDNKNHNNWYKMDEFGNQIAVIPAINSYWRPLNYNKIKEYEDNKRKEEIKIDITLGSDDNMYIEFKDSSYYNFSDKSILKSIKEAGIFTKWGITNLKGNGVYIKYPDGSKKKFTIDDLTGAYNIE